MRYHGTAGVVAIVLIGLVGATLGAMASRFSAEAHRTTQLATDAQLRQLLIAGTKIIQQHPDQDARELELPPNLRENTHLRVTDIQHTPTGIELTMQAIIDRRQLSQILSFESKDGAWILTASHLAP